jgi:hypothetical protein
VTGKRCDRRSFESQLFSYAGEGMHVVHDSRQVLFFKKVDGGEQVSRCDAEVGASSDVLADVFLLPKGNQ